MSTVMSEADRTGCAPPRTTVNSPALRKAKKPNVHAAHSMVVLWCGGVADQARKSMFKISTVMGKRRGWLPWGLERDIPRRT